MLENLSSKLKNAITKITMGSVDKQTVEELIREIQRALISGDVDVKLVNELSENIRRRAFEKIPEDLKVPVIQKIRERKGMSKDIPQI